MNTLTQLSFLTSRINELETAVFHSHSNSVLNLNPSIIRTLKTDDAGNIWFYVNKPPQAVTEFEKQFPVALNYYKKGAPFFLNVFGIARIVIDPEELVCANVDNEISIPNNKLLLSVRIANVNYYEKEIDTKKSWLTKLKKTFSELFISEENFYYNPELENEGHFA
jgi:hypothetical protein